MGGRTPGKSAVGLRTVNSLGGQASPAAILVRNALRIFDYLIGVLMIMLDRRSRRLGDLVASTLVIHDPPPADEQARWAAGRRISPSARSRSPSRCCGGCRASRRSAPASWPPGILAGLAGRDPAFAAGAPGDPQADPVFELWRLFAVDQAGPRRAGARADMDYRRFAELRAPLWDELEQGLERARAGRLDYLALERLSLLYRQVLHDHSIARSRFAGTAIARRLQRLMLEATHRLQRDSGEEVPTLGRFVLRIFPRTFRRLHPEIGVAVAIFCAATLLGAVLAAAQPAVASLFLPQGTIDNLRHGELWTDAILEPPARARRCRARSRSTTSRC